MKQGKPCGCRGSKLGPGPLPSLPLPTELSKDKLPHVSLELEIRPLAAAGLIFHLGQAQATPYVQLQVLTEQVSRAVVLRDFPLHHCPLVDRT